VNKGFHYVFDILWWSTSNIKRSRSNIVDPFLRGYRSSRTTGVPSHSCSICAFK